MTQEATTRGTEHHGVGIDLRFGSSAVRLSAAQWLVAGAIVAAFMLLAPTLWEKAEPFAPGADYRLPYSLSSDYWLYSRYARATAAASDRVLVIGDSVIWGQYVANDQTLSHYLSREAGGGARLANLGLDGAHPVALAGLLQYYGGDIAGRRVLLHCNLLWTASKKHDLQEKKEFRFNHPALVPQFVPEIPCYAETFSRRLSIAIDRRAPFSAWANHLRVAYLGQADLAAWTLQHPYENPVEALWPDLPRNDDRPQHDAAPWTERGIQRQSFAWVDLDGSLQWRCFRRTVEILRERGNQVFVLIGPFNEHMLEDANRAVYAERKRTVEAWLRENGVPCLAPDALPSHLYADASHPLSDGYALLARRLVEDKSFGSWLAD
jgi:lysophospholipase L1-like esterase